jgi:hypothetical protein
MTRLQGDIDFEIPGSRWRAPGMTLSPHSAACA